jgi:hypothetical protein
MHRKQALGSAVRLAVLGIVGVHFTLTVCYVMPLNPITMRYHGLLMNTIGRFFRQNWSLFAPTPVQNNQRMLVRVLNSKEASGVSLPIDGWYDLTSPLIARHQQNRFSAYDRLNRTQANALRDYYTGGIRLRLWLDACQRGSREACRHYQDGLNAERGYNGDLLRLAASAFCKDIHAQCTKVAVRLRETPVAPWSARNSGRAMPTRDFEVAVFDVAPEVVPSGIYAQKVSE